MTMVTGSGLGLFNTSQNVLDAVVGQGVMRQSGSQTYVNAANGNLVLQAFDGLRKGNSLTMRTGMAGSGPMKAGWSYRANTAAPATKRAKSPSAASICAGAPSWLSFAPDTLTFCGTPPGRIGPGAVNRGPASRGRVLKQNIGTKVT